MSDGSRSRFPPDSRERLQHPGWEHYHRAIELLEHSEWLLALQSLAIAETEFRAHNDQPGMWRSLSGQALAHWCVGDTALAIARVSAAIRIAETAQDILGVGLTAWQMAMLMVLQGDYQRSAGFLMHAARALELRGAANQTSDLKTAAHLCLEILRWQDLYKHGLIAPGTATEVTQAVQRDLQKRLAQAAADLRAHTGERLCSVQAPMLTLGPGPASELLVPSMSLGQRVARWWRGLRAGQVRPATLPPVVTPVPTAPPLPFASASPSSPATLPPAPDTAPSAEPLPTPQVLSSSPSHPSDPPASMSPEVELRPSPQPHSGARIAVTCFGHFRVTIDDQPVERWESSRARTIFKYLAVRRATPAPKELLAELFWHESEPDLARRSLHQAIYCLRQSLKRVAPDLAIVMFANDCYYLNPEAMMWIDAEEFTRLISAARTHLAAGEHAAAMNAYATAVDLVRGEFLEEERYEAWAEELRHTYQAMISEALHRLASYYAGQREFATSILYAQRILAQERCDEEAHLLLMRAYVAQGLRHLAVRQYQICLNALRTELGLDPSPELEQFYRQVIAVE
ncbi:MAG: BTAD domain-containing putative transcriptional regulator [Oscillochloridaceae bacterium]|nr:hypothetical protein [Chloroflexaceae bacterium]MDW8391122.1 BTAD domain-containing putative transcriptional regulator [Oscillochloridaceae bacterium]